MHLICHISDPIKLQDTSKELSGVLTCYVPQYLTLTEVGRVNIDSVFDSKMSQKCSYVFVLEVVYLSTSGRETSIRYWCMLHMGIIARVSFGRNESLAAPAYRTSDVLQNERSKVSIKYSRK